MPRGLFITFEGGEGVGKTTQIMQLEASLKEKEFDVIITREPGGCPAAEEIRGLLRHHEHGGRWTAKAELMLLFAARAMHIHDVIAPALVQSTTVLCDRYIDSTRVYQGDTQGVDADFIASLEKQIVGDVVPDITFVLDLPADIAMARVQERGALDHYDRGSLEFYEGLRQGFLNIVKDNPARCVRVDASQDKEIIAATILKAVEEKLK